MNESDSGSTELRRQSTDGPIIPNVGGERMGRIRPGTRLAVRRATREEIVEQWDRLNKYGDAIVAPYAFLVVFADEPEKVLHDWFSPRGGWYKDAAREEAEKYARARGATVVELDSGE